MKSAAVVLVLGAMLLAPAVAEFPLTAQQVANYSGTLVRRDSTPVRSAKIRLSGVERSLVTDDSGRYEFRERVPGRYTVSITPPGVPPVSLEVVLAPGESHHTRIVLEDVQQFQNISPGAEGTVATTSRLEMFERRRKRGQGVFLTAADLARRNPRVLSDALVNINGTQLVMGGNGKILISARGVATGYRDGLLTPTQCALRLVIDGMAMPAGTSVDEISPEDVAGIEIYAGAATLPMELMHFQEDNWCGAVLVWTRGG